MGGWGFPGKTEGNDTLTEVPLGTGTLAGALGTRTLTEGSLRDGKASRWENRENAKRFCNRSALNSGRQVCRTRGVFEVDVMPATVSAQQATADCGHDAAMLHCRQVIERLLKAHEGYFDIKRDYQFGGRTFPGYGEFHSTASSYVLVKRAKLWEASAHEYLFFLDTLCLDQSYLDDAVGFIVEKGLEKVQLSPSHMTSYLSLVIIADRAEEEAMRAVRRMRFRKNFRWGLQGWADLRLAAVDLSAGLVETNAMAKELRATLEANAFCVA